jgi:hypothetical protein
MLSETFLASTLDCSQPWHGFTALENSIRYIHVQTPTKQHTSFDHASSALLRLPVSAECLAWSVFTVFFHIKV